MGRLVQRKPFGSPWARGEHLNLHATADAWARHFGGGRSISLVVVVAQQGFVDSAWFMADSRREGSGPRCQEASFAPSEMNGGGDIWFGH